MGKLEILYEDRQAYRVRTGKYVVSVLIKRNEEYFTIDSDCESSYYRDLQFESVEEAVELGFSVKEIAELLDNPRIQYVLKKWIPKSLLASYFDTYEYVFKNGLCYQERK